MKTPKKVPKTWHWLGKKYHLVEEVKDGGRELIISKRYTSTGWDYHIDDRAVVLHRLKWEKEYS